MFEAFWSDDPGAALMHEPTYMRQPPGLRDGGGEFDLFEKRYWRGRFAGLEGLRRGLRFCGGIGVVVDVRVMGAIGVVEFEAAVDVGRVVRGLPSWGLWIRPMGKVVYLTPGL